jgi:TonB-linked SusC/RagA family outer membrane protein
MFKKRFLKAIMLFVMVLSLQVAHAQLKTVTGVIKDDKGVPVAGATVKAKGSSEATKTADDGSFSLDVQPATTSLVISSVGFGDQTVSVDNASAVTLKHKATELEDVTVNTVNIGYGTQRRKDVTGSISSVKGADIKDLPTQNVAAALEGRVAGVDVTSSSSEPGKQSQITIRGVSSLFQANPLYVIDGIIQRGNPVSDNGPDIGNNINPADIASIDVLKDAAATAIYGAAAAGGVIIITTKKGLGSKPTVNFSSRYGVTKPELIHLLDSKDFITFKDDIKDPSYVFNTDTDTFPNTDWVKAMYRNGIEQNYSLSMSGAAGPTGVAPTVNYYMSGVYNDQKGVFLNNSSELYGFKLNSDFKITNHIKAGETIDAYQRNTTPVDYDPDPSSPVNASRLNAPFRTVPTMNIFGSVPGTYATNAPGFYGGNPIAQILSKDRNITQDNVAANVYGEVKLPLALTFRATLGYTIFNEQGNSLELPFVAGGDVVSNTRLFKSFVSYKSLLNAYTLAHDKSYGNHNLNVLIGYEQYQGTYNALYTNEVDVIPAKFSYFPQSNSITANSISTGGYDPYPLVESEFGRINYNYNHKYFLSASIRRDADYLKFGPGNQAGVFPAVSAGWIASDEAFFKKALPKINFLKIRASYGSVGNSGNGSLPPYIFLAGYSPNASQGFAPGASPLLTYTQNRIANSDIKWETTTETNIGVDGEALHSKLFFTVEWYNKSTKDLLYKLPLPVSSGFSYYYANIGSVNNKGVDILLGYKDHVSEVNYTLTFTGSFNKNKVLDLNGINNNPVFDGSTDLGPIGSQGKWTGDGLTYTAPGHPFGQFWGLKTEGIFKTDAEGAAAGYTVNGYTPRAGDLKYWDKNGDHQITNADDTIIGNPYPKFTYGFKANFSWRGFDLAVLFHGVYGVDILNGTKAYTQSYFNDGNTTSKIFGASYFGTNGLTSQPREGIVNGPSFTQDPNGNYSRPSSYFVENGNYLKIQNIQLGYTFSNKWLKKVNMTSARLYVMGNNILTITHYSGLDPELGSQDQTSNGGTTNRGIDGPYKYPAARTYTVGLDVNF